MRIRRLTNACTRLAPDAPLRARGLSRLLPPLLMLVCVGLTTASCTRGDAPAPAGSATATANGAGASSADAGAAAANAGFPRTLRDSTGAALTLAAAPRRIVSQTLGTDEILFAICPHDRLVALSPFARDADYSNITKEAAASGLPAVNGAEDIIRLKPDLIFIASYSRAETVDLLRASRAPLFRFASFERVDDVLGNIKIIGQAIGEERAAEALITESQRRLAAARARIPAGRPQPRVMSLSSYGTTAAANTLFDDIIRQAGAINVSAERGLTGFPQISAEQVLAWQPDFIVFDAKAGQEDEARRRFRNDPALAATRAVREGRLILMPGGQFLTVSHHVVDAVDTLVGALYGARAQPASSASSAAAAPVQAPAPAPPAGRTP
jgi:iron complex transport system substrate-binding protein